MYLTKSAIIRYIVGMSLFLTSIKVGNNTIIESKNIDKKIYKTLGGDSNDILTCQWLILLIFTWALSQACNEVS